MMFWEENYDIVIKAYIVQHKEEKYKSITYI